MNEDLMLEKRLENLRAKHHELDEMINAGMMDEFTKMRLKKEKLDMRTKIHEIERLVYPDVIA